jgi:hypothetical protein
MVGISGKRDSRWWVAIGIGAALVALALLAGALAAWLEGGDPSQSLDPHHRGAGTAAVFAAVFCIFALRKLKQLGRDRAGWGEVLMVCVFAVGGLLFLDAVAFGSRLGG